MAEGDIFGSGIVVEWIQAAQDITEASRWKFHSGVPLECSVSTPEMEFCLNRELRMIGNKRGITLMNVVVRRKYRRQGHCTRLLDVIEEAAREAKLDYIKIQSVSSDEMVWLLEARKDKAHYEMDGLGDAYYWLDP